MKQELLLPPPPPSLIEEWDNPEMAEFKRQEQIERELFAQSHSQEEWLVSMRTSQAKIGEFQVCPKPQKVWPEKIIKLPW